MSVVVRVGTDSHVDLIVNVSIEGIGDGRGEETRGDGSMSIVCLVSDGYLPYLC